MHERIAYLGLLDDEAIELDVAALELSAIDHPATDLDPYRAILGAISGRVTALGEHAVSPVQRAEVLAHVIAGEYGFAGDRESYDAPVNADMIRVIDRRRGLPISLSILFVATARRAGWAADPINMPGHVLVRIGDNGSSLLIDPFQGGGLVDPREMAALLAQRGGADGWPIAHDLPVMTNRDALVRLLINQASRAEQGRDGGRATAIYERMTIIAPGHGQGWWDLARLQLARGQRDEARGSLSALLEVTRDPEHRQRIRTVLEAIAGQTGG